MERRRERRGRERGPAAGVGVHADGIGAREVIEAEQRERGDGEQRLGAPPRHRQAASRHGHLPSPPRSHATVSATPARADRGAYPRSLRAGSRSAGRCSRNTRTHPGVIGTSPPSPPPRGAAYPPPRAPPRGKGPPRPPPPEPSP